MFFLLCRYTDTHYKWPLLYLSEQIKSSAVQMQINSLSICQTLGPLRVHMEHQIPPRPLAHHQHCHQRFIRRRHHPHGLCSLRQCGLRATVVTPSSGDPPFLLLSLPQRSLGILSIAPGRKRPPPFFAIIFWGKDGALPPLSALSIVWL
jgi:hypothetical protein